jgi:very-short-patch-repair endonuclease
MERQHGPVHYEQLREAGLSRGQIEYRLATKQIRRVHPEVYVAQYRELTVLGSWSAAVLAGGEEAFLGCRSCGQFHRIVDRYDGPIEILVARPDAPKIAGIKARKATFGPGETTVRSNIRVTTLERTLLDLAGLLTTDELSQAFQRAMRLGLYMKRLEAIIAHHPRANGRRNLRKLIARHKNDKGTGRGDFENAVYTWLTAWLPKRFTVRRNVRFVFDDGVEREADFLIDERVWIEVDFHGHHAGAGAKKTTEDHQRDRAIRRAGFQLGRYTDYEFTHDKAAIKADIEYLLG